MKVYKASLFGIFLAATTAEISAFVPARLGTVRIPLHSKSNKDQRTFRPRHAATLDQLDQDASINSLKDESGRIFSNLDKFTDILLDEESYPVGSLSQDVTEAAFEILFESGKLESVEGAQNVEKLVQRFEKESPVVLNAKDYTVLVNAWSKSGHPKAGEKSEQWLTRMEELAKTNPLVAPTKVTYSAVANAYAAQGNALRAREILSRMEAGDNLMPTFNDYNAVLLAFARDGDGRGAEAILKKMVDLCKETGSSEFAPDLYSDNNVISAWANSREKGAHERALQILDALRGLAKEDPALQPCKRTYTAVITTIVRSDDPKAADLALDVFDQAINRGIKPDAFMYCSVMQAYANEGNAKKAEEILRVMEKNDLSNKIAYNTLLKACKNSSSPMSAERAEANLERMITMGFADTISFTTVMAAYAQRGDLKAAEKAESILRRMQELYLAEGDEKLKPNLTSFNTALNAWVKAGIPERAGLLLERMINVYEEGNVDMCPNVVSFSTVINGWARTTSPKGLANSEELFRRMVELYEAGNQSARPNKISYVSLINAITRSGDPDKAERAEKVLFQMYKQYQDGHNDLKPTAKTIAMVLDAWQKSGKPDAGERAEALLDWMLGLYKEAMDKRLEPNEYIYSSVISAWSKSHCFGKAPRARRVLEKMRKMHDSGAISAAPNTHCYTGVINSCAYCLDDELEKKDALKIALATYKESERTSEHGRPNHVTYATMLAALNNLLDPSPERTAAMGSIFKRCCITGQVDSMVLRRLETSLSPSELQEVLCTEDLVTPEGEIKRGALPVDWQSNLRLRSTGSLKASLDGIAA